MFTIIHGKKNHVIKLDCRSAEFEFFPLEMSGYMIVLVNTGVKHSFDEGCNEYNNRRKSCERGVKALQLIDPSIETLRDVTLEFLEEHKAKLDEVVYKRCCFVLEEN